MFILTEILSFSDFKIFSKTHSLYLEAVYIEKKSSPSFKRVASMKFMAGEPMKPTTNLLVGCLYASRGDRIAAGDHHS